MISAARVCGKCGAKISSDATRDVCPACLLENGFGLIDDRKKTSRSAKILGDFGDYELLEEIGRGGHNLETAGKFEGLVLDLLAFTANSEKNPEWKPDSFFKRFAQH